LEPLGKGKPNTFRLFMCGNHDEVRSWLKRKSVTWSFFTGHSKVPASAQDFPVEAPPNPVQASIRAPDCCPYNSGLHGRRYFAASVRKLRGV